MPSSSAWAKLNRIGNGYFSHHLVTIAGAVLVYPEPCVGWVRPVLILESASESQTVIILKYVVVVGYTKCPTT